MAYVKIPSGTGYTYWQESPQGLQAISDPATLRGLQSGAIPSVEQGQIQGGADRFSSTPQQSVPVQQTAQTQQAASGAGQRLTVRQNANGTYDLYRQDGTLQEGGLDANGLQKAAEFYNSKGFWSINQSDIPAQPSAQIQPEATTLPVQDTGEQSTQLGGELYNTLKTYLDELQRRGLSVNPNVDITPEQVAAFLKQAENEINPYFSTQLKTAREMLLRSIGYTKDQLLRKEEDLQRQYESQLESVGDKFAEAGFALGGRRMKTERDLADETQRTIDEGRRQLEFASGTATREFAQQFGTEALGQAPTIGTAPRVLAGEKAFAPQTGERALYSLSPEVYDGLVGEQEFARRGAVKTRASELEGAFRTNTSLENQRQLTL